MIALIFIVLFFLTPSTICQTIQTPQLTLKKVVLWGHKLGSHSHSFIHYGFYKAFQYLGYETYWFDNDDEVSNFDFSNCLFITEGQVDQNIPLRSDCFYILHWCNQKKYQSLFDQRRCYNLIAFIYDHISNQAIKIEDCIYYDLPNKILLMPWATDLLPHEIDQVKSTIAHKFGFNSRKKLKAIFVGSLGPNPHGNEEQLMQFAKACRKSRVKFQQFGFFGQKLRASIEENYRLVQEADFAPAIQGPWQCEHGYIPCRIFKNISYGKPGITNSKTVYDLFHQKIVYNPNCYQLFFDARKQLKTWTLKQQYELMDFVRDHHTYINRIGHLLQFMKLLLA